MDKQIPVYAIYRNLLKTVRTCSTFMVSSNDFKLIGDNVAYTDSIINSNCRKMFAQKNFLPPQTTTHLNISTAFLSRLTIPKTLQLSQLTYMKAITAI